MNQAWIFSDLLPEMCDLSLMNEWRLRENFMIFTHWHFLNYLELLIKFLKLQL